MRGILAGAFGLVAAGVAIAILVFFITEGRLPGAGEVAADGGVETNSSAAPDPAVPVYDRRNRAMPSHLELEGDPPVTAGRAGGPSVDAAETEASAQRLPVSLPADRPAPQLGAGAMITGTVLDDRRRPVEGARVSAVSFDDPSRVEGESVTESDGSFTLRGLAPGDPYRLVASKQGFLQLNPISHETVEEAAPAGRLVITLVRAAAISGRVLTPDGRAGADAAVRLTQQGHGKRLRGVTVRASKRGQFELQAIAPGRYLLFADHPDYGPSESLEVEIVPGAVKNGVTLSLLRLPYRGRIEGQVVSTDGEPIEGAEVTGYAETDSPEGTVETTTAISGEEGSFTLKGVGPSRYTLLALAPGFVGSSLATLTGAQPIRASAGEFVVIELPRGATIGGRVVDGEAAPVTEFVVNVLARIDAMAEIEAPCKRESFSSQEGDFEVTGLIAGVTAVEVSADGFAAARIVLPYFEPDDYNDLGVVTLTPGASISGLVQTRRGEPIPDAVVSLEFGGAGGDPTRAGAKASWQAPSATTRRDGAFELAHVAAGEYSIVAVHPQYSAARRSIEVPEDGELTDFKLVLSSGGAIAGVVLDSTGRRVSGVSIDAFPKDGWSPSEGSQPKTAVTDSEGSYRLGGLRAGQYVVHASFEKGTSRAKRRTKTVTVPEDGDVACDFVEDAPCRLYGTVFGYRAGEGREPAVMSLIGASGEGRTSTRIQPDGSYSFEPMPPGEYVIQLATRTVGFPVTLPPMNEYRHDIDLSAGSISGRVVRRDGEPLGMAYVIAIPESSAGGEAQLARATSDPNGEFSLRDLADGVYDVRVESASYGAGSATGIRVTGGADVTGIDIVVEQTGGKLVVAVHGAGGELERQAFVLCQDAQGNIIGAGSVSTDDRGEKVLSGLPPGTYRVIAGAAGASSAWLDGVTVERDADRRAEITLPDRRGRIRVQVTQGGSPTPGAAVQVVDGSGRAVPDGNGFAGSYGGLTGDDGLYQSGFFPAGTYTVRVTVGSAGVAEQSVTIPGDDSTITIAIRL